VSFADLAKNLFLPPIGLLLVALLGLLLGLHWRWRRVGWGVSLASLLALLVLAMPVTGIFLVVALESGLPVTPTPGQPPKAIVILSAEAVPVDGDGARFEPGKLTWERLRAGAQLARQEKLPIMVSGGMVSGGPMPAHPPPLADLMARGLAEQLNVPVRWRETRARDTWENAKYSAEMLRAAGIKSVYMVSHAWHLRRAIAAFARFGIVAIAAPVRMDRWPRGTLEEFVPSLAGWTQSRLALHEWIGGAYYALR
jgi:uncharacterized SAM-binding protein YcdF (DUF218 family)